MPKCWSAWDERSKRGRVTPVQAETISQLSAGRDWLFGEYDTYIDTSHLLSVLQYTLEIEDTETLKKLYDLCQYGRKLSPMFQSRGQAPFDNTYIDYGEYILAVLGDDVDARLSHFAGKSRRVIRKRAALLLRSCSSALRFGSGT